jgi:hypothetical protein
LRLQALHLSQMEEQAFETPGPASEPWQESQNQELHDVVQPQQELYSITHLPTPGFKCGCTCQHHVLPQCSEYIPLRLCSRAWGGPVPGTGSSAHASPSTTTGEGPSLEP